MQIYKKISLLLPGQAPKRNLHSPYRSPLPCPPAEKNIGLQIQDVTALQSQNNGPKYAIKGIKKERTDMQILVTTSNIM